MDVAGGGVEMSLTAREWLLLSQSEQKERGKELSPKECSKLRMELSEIHFSEEYKRNMSEEERERFIHPPKFTEEERKKFNRRAKEIFSGLQKEAEIEKHAIGQ